MGRRANVTGSRHSASNSDPVYHSAQTSEWLEGLAQSEGTRSAPNVIPPLPLFASQVQPAVPVPKGVTFPSRSTLIERLLDPTCRTNASLGLLINSKPRGQNGDVQIFR